MPYIIIIVMYISIMKKNRKGFCMKAIKNITIICLLFFAIGFSACEKIADDTPKAIKKLIRQHKAEGQIAEYEYNKECIYMCFSSGCCDCLTDYYDKDANLLWQTGGFDGMGDGNCPEDFGEKAIFKRIVWTSKSTEKYLKESKK